MVTVDLTAATRLHSVEEFRNLVIRQVNGAIVRLGDVAKVSLGSEDYDTAVAFDGESAVYIGIKVAPSANLLTVIQNVRKAFPPIEEQLPEGLDARIVYDATKYVNSSIREVVSTLVQALLIVTVVIFLFLASVRSVIIPVDRHAPVADRGVLHHAGPRLHDQPADPARPGARHRPRRR